MAGLVKIAAPPKFVCCVREQMLREHTLHQQKAGLSRYLIVGPVRSEGPVSATSNLRLWFYLPSGQSGQFIPADQVPQRWHLASRPAV